MTGSAVSAVETVSAASVSRALACRAFNVGFEGYVVPVNLNVAQFDAMIASEAIDLGASLVALDGDHEPAGIALLAIRGDECWCGGLGVVPQWRRGGIGRRLMVRLLAAGAERGLERMRLEVIDGNDAARALYDTLGFESRRRYDVFQGQPTGRAAIPRDLIELPDAEIVWEAFAAYHPSPPAWQRDLPSLRRAQKSGQQVCLGLGSSERPTAYVFAFVANGVIRIADSGVDRSVDDAVERMIGLIGGLVQRFRGHAVVSVNVPEDDPLNGALRALGVPVTLTQTELTRALDSNERGASWSDESAKRSSSTCGSRSRGAS
jgi:GNAT superfamily N-acetyltransferase